MTVGRHTATRWPERTWSRWGAESQSAPPLVTTGRRPRLSTNHENPQPIPNVHTYNGTAAVGDLITITVDRDAHTIAFHNWSTGNSGTLSYTVDADGAFLVTDPNGEIIKAYEIPGFALVAWDHKAKDGTQMALVFAFEQVATQVSDFRNLSLASVQFRTADGGTEIFCGSVDSAGILNSAGYQPVAVLYPPAFSTKTGVDFGSYLTADPATGTLIFYDPNKPDPPAHMFKTESGAWVIDAAMGSVLMFPSAAAGAFDSSAAGTYFVLGYRKTGESTGVDNPSYGTPSFFNEVVTLSSSGALSDGTNTVQLVPLRQPYNGTELDIDPCNGLFAFTSADGGEGFAFVYGNAIYFSTFHMTDAVAHLYDYSYGVALRK